MSNKKANILLVEDDENMGFILKDYLEMLHYTVDLRKNGVDGLHSFKARVFDICILDVMMPLKDGFTLASEIKEINEDMPVIFLTAKEMKEDRIKGFRIGADDYITKPFSTEELSLRIEAILRRVKKSQGKEPQELIFELGNLTFNYTNQLLKNKTNSYTLTKKEAELLKMLCENKNSVLRRETALKKIWGDDDYFMGRSMDVYITKLRKYFKDEPLVTISNIHGTGFKLEIKSSE
ncbi:MAG: response regulator transcription factor [Bacteroidia bacterium]|nr:response regulator transcription factor [Bacteroidia bacterium]